MRIFSEASALPSKGEIASPILPSENVSAIGKWLYLSLRENSQLCLPNGINIRNKSWLM